MDVSIRSRLSPNYKWWLIVMCYIASMETFGREGCRVPFVQTKQMTQLEWIFGKHTIQDKNEWLLF